jgi:hypothetical protein
MFSHILSLYHAPPEFPLQNTIPTPPSRRRIRRAPFGPFPLVLASSINNQQQLSSASLHGVNPRKKMSRPESLLATLLETKQLGPPHLFTHLHLPSTSQHQEPPSNSSSGSSNTPPTPATFGTQIATTIHKHNYKKKKKKKLLKFAAKITTRSSIRFNLAFQSRSEKIRENVIELNTQAQYAGRKLLGCTRELSDARTHVSMSMKRLKPFHAVSI